MTDFRRQAENVKLARLLRTTPEALDFLATLDADQLSELRVSCTKLLLDKHREQFRRIASASKLLPTTLVARIAEKALGPLLCARVAGEMHTQRAIDICKRLSPDFMAASAIHMETERARELTTALPLQSVHEIADRLLAKREFITVADLVAELPLSFIEPILLEFHSGEALLRTAFFIEDPARLNAILDLLPPNLLQAVIRAAADENLDLWPHALALMSVVSAKWRQRLVNMALTGDETTLASMIRGVARHDLWQNALPLIELMTESHRRQLANLAVLRDDAILRRLLHAADTNDLWHQLLPLVPFMDDSQCQRVARLADELNETAVRHLIEIIHNHNLWQPALLLIEKMGKVHRATIAEVFAESPDIVIVGLVHSVQEHRQWHLVLPLIATMTEKTQRRFVSLPLFQQLLIAAESEGLCDLLLQRMAEMSQEERQELRATLQRLPEPHLPNLRERCRILGFAELLD